MTAPEPGTVGAVLAAAAARLDAAGVEAPRREARLLLAAALGLPRAALLPDARARVEAPGFEAMLARRAAREPLALITGRQGFWTLDLAVSSATLVPRADSETLVEAALACHPERASVRHVLDLGTGTGALLLAALAEFAGSFGVGVDRSEAACRLARVNARDNGLGERAAFVCADWTAPLAGRFDLILANPPYIESEAVGALMPEVAVHEPASALDGGADGLDAYRAILPCLPPRLSPGGVAILELGRGQARAVCALAAREGLAKQALCRDLSGIERALVLRAGVSIA